MGRENATKIIDNALQQFNHAGDKIALLVVANMQSDTIEKDYLGHSIASSFSSDKELDEFINGLKEFVDYTDVFYGEKDFINKLCNRYFEKFDSYKKVIYTDTASGTARSKSALIPALCENYNFAYCSNDIFTSALLDNKMATYGILQSYGLPVPKTWIYHHKLKWINGEPPEEKVLIAKPAYECASVGISNKSVSQLNKQFLSFIHDLSISLKQPILVQEFISGYEVEVPVFDLEEPLTPGTVGISFEEDMRLGDNFFTYDMIFEDGFKLFDFEKVDQNMSEKLKKISRLAYSSLQLKGPVRFDFRIDNSIDNCYLMDYNNSPHLGRNHSFAHSLNHLGYTYEDMLKLIVYPALAKPAL